MNPNDKMCYDIVMELDKKELEINRLKKEIELLQQLNIPKLIIEKKPSNNGINPQDFINMIITNVNESSHHSRITSGLQNSSIDVTEISKTFYNDEIIIKTILFSKEIQIPSGYANNWYNGAISHYLFITNYSSLIFFRLDDTDNYRHIFTRFHKSSAQINESFYLKFNKGLDFKTDILKITGLIINNDNSTENLWSNACYTINTFKEFLITVI